MGDGNGEHVAIGATARRGVGVWKEYGMGGVGVGGRFQLRFKSSR